MRCHECLQQVSGFVLIKSKIQLVSPETSYNTSQPLQHLLIGPKQIFVTSQRGGTILKNGHNVRNTSKSPTACQVAYPAVHMLPQKRNFFKRIQYATCKTPFFDCYFWTVRGTEGLPLKTPVLSFNLVWRGQHHVNPSRRRHSKCTSSNPVIFW